jgi:hypothetical protein
MRLAKNALAILVAIALMRALGDVLDLVIVALNYFSPYQPLVLIALGVLVRVVARRRGWGGEWRLTRLVNRPRFVDEMHRGPAIAENGGWCPGKDSNLHGR